jgi:exopolyphosphatase/guanosine-5'-triphosphate,3'-diphosphate pyrophosphatase
VRIAVVDIGTNSTRLLVANISFDEMSVLKTGLITTRLGEGIGTRNYLIEPAIERTIAALYIFKKEIDEYNVDKIVVAATSAVRDASNKQDFIDAVKLAVGWDVLVLAGEEEAKMSYQGVVKGIKGVINNPVVIDIGGGSTEFIWSAGSVINFVSLRIGAVRMTEKNSHITEIKEGVSELTHKIRTNEFLGLIGVGGTLTTLAAIDQRLKEYNPAKVHGYFLKKYKIKEILERLEKMTVEDRMNVHGLQPQRADIIVAGTKIALAVVEELDTEGITVSETDIMNGLLFQAFEEHK